MCEIKQKPLKRTQFIIEVECNNQGISEMVKLLREALTSHNIFYKLKYIIDVDIGGNI